MARYNYRRRMTTKQLVSLILGILLTMGCVFGAFNFFGSDKRTISPTAFSVGGLDGNGQYIDSDNTIFTEDMIECQGLSITPDLKTKASYQVFFYDHNKELVEASGILSNNMVLNNTLVQYCRIVIYPEDYMNLYSSLSIVDVWSIASDFKIEVNRKQSFTIKNYFEAGKRNKVATVNYDEYVEKDGYGASKLVSIEGLKELTILYSHPQPEAIEILFFEVEDIEDGTMYTHVKTETTQALGTTEVVFVPEGATHMIVNYKLSEGIEINGI